MSTRWESSGGPLYVRTVWRDGQRHVLLRRGAVGGGERRLAGVGRRLDHRTPDATLRRYKNPANRCKTSIQPRGALFPDTDGAGAVVAFVDAKKIPRASPRPGKNLNNLSIKSHSIEIRLHREADFRPHFGHDADEPNKSNCFRSLSQRVLLWLDLATRAHGKTKDVPQLKGLPVGENKVLARHDVTRRNEEDNVPEKEESHDEQQQRQDSPEDLLSHSTISCKNHDVSKSDQQRPLTVRSQLEGNLSQESVGEGPVVPKNPPCRPITALAARKQLHIFMPNLPKKISSRDSSVLSSKLSSCVNSVDSGKFKYLTN